MLLETERREREEVHCPPETNACPLFSKDPQEPHRHVVISRGVARSPGTEGSDVRTPYDIVMLSLPGPFQALAALRLERTRKWLSCMLHSPPWHSTWGRCPLGSMLIMPLLIRQWIMQSRQDHWPLPFHEVGKQSPMPLASPLLAALWEWTAFLSCPHLGNSWNAPKCLQLTLITEFRLHRIPSVLQIFFCYIS